MVLGNNGGNGSATGQMGRHATGMLAGIRTLATSISKGLIVHGLMAKGALLFPRQHDAGRERRSFSLSLFAWFHFFVLGFFHWYC